MTGSEAGHHQVARAAVPKEYLSLGVGVQWVHMVHQLPPLQRHPAPLGHVLWAGTSLAQVAFLHTVLQATMDLGDAQTENITELLCYMKCKYL